MDNTNNQIYGNMSIHQCEICDGEFKTKSGSQNHFSTIHCKQKENNTTIQTHLFNPSANSSIKRGRWVKGTKNSDPDAKKPVCQMPEYG